MKTKTALILTAVVLVLLLLLPVIFKEKGPPPLVGPDLAELEYSEVFFENVQRDFQLAGMLFLPEGEGPFPTAVLIQGAGPSERSNTWYSSVAKHLQDNGIAVLLPDKRGCEKSEGEWKGVSLEELATDTLSAVEFVKQQRIFEYSTIGLIGFSQGGWIAPIAAAQSDDVFFVVSLSGPAVTTDEQLLYQQTVDIGSYTYTFIAGLIAPLTVDGVRQKEHLAALYPFDPIPFWREVHVPVFFAFGENDRDTPVDASIRRLEESNLGHFNIKVYPDGGHGITDSQTHRVSAEFLQDLVRFINFSFQ